MPYLTIPIGFPQFVEYGEANKQNDYLVMSLHGEKISFLKEYHTTKIEHNRIMDIAQQVVRSLQKMHRIGYVHWDIKPHNILNSCSERDEFDEAPEISPNKYVLIDFGISWPYLDDLGLHIPMTKTSKFRGSIEFWAADILAQFRKNIKYNDLEPTRKHDMESLMYTILHLHKNKKTLWKSTMDFGFDSSSEDNNSIRSKLKKFSDRKKNADPYYMCRDIHNQEELAKLYIYIMDLEYSQEPDYDYIIEW
jgi:serine/threonine protein kinase